MIQELLSIKAKLREILMSWQETPLQIHNTPTAQYLQRPNRNQLGALNKSNFKQLISQLECQDN